MDGINEQGLIGILVASALKGLATDAVVAGFKESRGWLLIAVERAVHGREGVGLRKRARARFEREKNACLRWGGCGRAVAGGDIDSSELGCGGGKLLQEFADLREPVWLGLVVKLEDRGVEAVKMCFEKLGLSVNQGKAFEEMHSVSETAIGERDGAGRFPAFFGCKEERT